VSQLPKGWVKCKLSEFSAIEMGQSPKGEFVGDSEIGLPFYQGKTEFGKWYPTPRKYCSQPTKIAEKNDILLSIRAPVGPTNLCPEKSCIGRGLASIRAFEEQSQKYLIHYFRYIEPWLSEQGTGSTFKAISGGFVRDIDVLVAPLNEQIRIADKLDSILAKVDRAQARLDKIPGILKRFRQSVLAAATSGELTKEWRDSNINESTVFSEIQELKINWARENAQHNEANRVLKRATEYDNKKPRINVELPSSWAFESLEDCVLMIVDCHNKTAPYVQSGIPLIRTSNIRDGKFIWEDLKFVDEETYAFWSKRCPPEQGDIIFTREAPMGEAAIIPPGQKVCLGQRTMLIRPIESHISASYLLLTIMDPGFKRRSDLLAVGTGVKHYRVGDVSNLKIPIPSSSEQTEIVRRVHDLFALAEVVEKNYVDTIQRVNLLSKSVLAKAFRGELVTQDSNDEPASKLLERIKSADVVSKEKKKAELKPKAASVKDVLIDDERIHGALQRQENFSVDLESRSHDLFRASYQAEILKAQKLLSDAKFSVEQFRSITDFKGGYDELKALIMNLLKGIPNISEPLLAIESWDDKSGEYLMHLVKQK